MALTNPFYPGKYPGERPLRTPPSGWGAPKQPVPGGVPEIDWFDMAAFATEAEMDLNRLNAPKWVWERYKYDFKQSLKLTDFGEKKLSPQDVENQAAGDENVFDAMPASVGASVDFGGFIIDPKKAFKDLTWGNFKNLASISELRMRDRRALWDHVLSDNVGLDNRVLEGIAGSTFAVAFGQASARAMETRISKADVLPRPITGNPYSLDHPLYYGLKTEILNLQAALPVRVNRERAYDSMLETGVKTLSNDLNKLGRIPTVYNKGVSAIKQSASNYNYTPSNVLSPHQIAVQRHRGNIANLVAASGTTNIVEARRHVDQILSFQAQAAVLDHISTTGDLLDKTNKALEAVKTTFSGSTEHVLASGQVVSISRKAKAQQELASKLNALKTHVESTDPELLNDLLSYMTDADRAAVSNLLSGFSGPGGSWETLQNELGSIADVTDYVSSLGRDGAIGLSTRLSTIQSGGATGVALVEGDLLRAGYKRRLLRYMQEQFTHDTETRTALSRVTAKGGVFFSILPRLEGDRYGEESRDYVFYSAKNAWLNGLVWTRVTNSVKVLTPGYWVNKALKSVHYFGLKIDEDHIDFRNGKDFALWKISLSDNNGNPGRMFGNWFGLNFTVNAGGPNAYAVNAKVFGGGHFNFTQNILTKINASSKTPANYALIDELFSITDPDLFKEKLAQIMDFKLGDSEDVKKLNGMIRDYKRLKVWLSKNGHLFGVTQQQLESPEFMVAFARSLNEYRVNIHNLLSEGHVGMTKKYVGLFQRALVRANELQSKVFMSRIGVILRPKHYMEEMIKAKLLGGSVKIAVQKAVDFIIARIADVFKLLGIATGFLETVVAKVVEVIIRWIVQKTIDVASKIFNAVVRLRFGELAELVKGIPQGIAHSVSSTLHTVGKITLYIILILIGTNLIVILLFMTITGGTSSSNPSVSGRGGGGGSGGSAGGGTGGGLEICEGATSPGIQCPLSANTFSVTAYSYQDNKNTDLPEDGGYHGVNSYWPASGSCTFEIPSYFFTSSASSGRAKAPSTEGSPNMNVCYSRTLGSNPPISPVYRQPYFGFALDLNPDADGTELLYLPEIIYEGNTVTEWTISNSDFWEGEEDIGAFAFFRGSSSSHEFALLYLHLPDSLPVGEVLDPGACVGGMSTASIYDEHVHVEVAVSEIGSGVWQILKPESILSC